MIPSTSVSNGQATLKLTSIYQTLMPPEVSLIKILFLFFVSNDVTHPGMNMFIKLWEKINLDNFPNILQIY